MTNGDSLVSRAVERDCFDGGSVVVSVTAVRWWWPVMVVAAGMAGSRRRGEMGGEIVGW